MASFRGSAAPSHVETDDSVDAADAQDRFAQFEREHALSRTIEAEIIPRLMLAHQAPRCDGPAGRADLRPTQAEVEEFASLLIAHEIDVASTFVDVMRERGLTLENVLLHLFTPAAAILDQMWRDDRCDFCDITIAFSRLQQILREISTPFEAEGDPMPGEKRALIAAAPGERHTFGVHVVEEFLRRAGWEVVCLPEASASRLVTLVRREWFDVVGFSLSCEGLLAGLGSAIDEIRRRSRNNRIGVIVGGNYFNECPESAGKIGADLVAFDGLDAVRKAQRYVGGAALSS